MSENSIFEILSHTADHQLVTVFDESYSQLIQHFESSPEQRSKSIGIFKRFLNLECLSNAQSLIRLNRICADLKLLYTKNLSKVDQLVAESQETACDLYCSLVGENCQVLSCTRDLLDRVQPDNSMSYIQSIVLNILSVLSATFKHCNDHSNFYACAAPIFNENINNLFRLGTELLFRCLDLVDSVKIDEDADVDQLNSVLEAAFDVGTLVSNLELKTMAQLWKSFTSLLQKHCATLQDRFDICRVICYFCREIEQKIDAVYELSAKNRLVTLKVLNFLLKVVLKLCEYFSDYLSGCLPDLCRLIALLFHNSSACAKYGGRSLEVVAEIETSLLPAVDPLICVLMKEDSFMKCFFELKRTSVSALLLLSAILQKLVLSPPESVTCELFHDVLQNICSCASELHFDVRTAIVSSTSLHLPQQVCLYDALLVHTASLIICTVSEQEFDVIQKLLITHLLQSPMAMKLFICDLWSILARYGSGELCFEQAKLLVRVVQRIHREKIESVVVKSLLRRVFGFLSRAYQQQLVILVGKDLDLLLEIVNPNVTGIVSVLDTVFIGNASKRILELKVSCGISVEDVDLLLRVRIACAMNEIELEPQIKELILSVWNQLGSIPSILSDCGLFLHCVQHLVILSKNYMLPHSATLPVVRRLANSGSVFLKILILDYLKSLSARKADDLDVDEFSSSVSSIFQTLLNDQNVLVRERAVETFSYFSHVTVYEKIIHITIADEPKLTECVMNFLQKKVHPVGDKSCDDFLKNLLENRRAKVVIDQPAVIDIVETISDAPEAKKIKLDFDFDCEMVEIDSRLKLLLSNLKSLEPSPTQKHILKGIVETADELRRHL